MEYTLSVSWLSERSPVALLLLVPLTVGSQNLRAARLDPARTLRDE